MRALLDINVLIALLDVDHLHHGRAREWLQENAVAGWSSCPLTQNGCVRIMSQPRYPNPLSTSAVAQRLRRATEQTIHEFWPADVSLLAAGLFDCSRIHGPRQVTDVYLLGLAARRHGRFVTFDGSVPTSAINDLGQEHLLVL